MYIICRNINTRRTVWPFMTQILSHEQHLISFESLLLSTTAQGRLLNSFESPDHFLIVSLWRKLGILFVNLKGKQWMAESLQESWLHMNRKKAWTWAGTVPQFDVAESCSGLGAWRKKTNCFLSLWRSHYCGGSRPHECSIYSLTSANRQTVVYSVGFKHARPS